MKLTIDGVEHIGKYKQINLSTFSVSYDFLKKCDDKDQVRVCRGSLMVDKERGYSI